MKSGAKFLLLSVWFPVSFILTFSLSFPPPSLFFISFSLSLFIFTVCVLVSVPLSFPVSSCQRLCSCFEMGQHPAAVIE